MKKLILTALDDNDLFWFDHLVPFLLSLEKTNYQGNIGIISYGLSNRKKEILHNNGFIIFEAANKYKTIYIDRQYTTAVIAERFDFEQVALFDTDIWFPSKNLTLFDELNNNENLYCAYDFSYGSFVEECINKPYRKDIRIKMQTFLSIHKNLWQVGVVAGHKEAWRRYNNFLTTALNKNEIFTNDYGVDTLLMVLYSIEYGFVSPLPTKYNCIPTCGKLKHSNINSNGEILDNTIFTIDDEEIQAIHITGPFRLYERNFYEFSYHYGNDYFNKGKKFSLFPKQVEIFDASSIKIVEKEELNDKFNSLTIDKIISTTPIHSYINNNNLFIETGYQSQLTLRNNNNYYVTFEFCIQHPLGKRIAKGRFIYHNNKSPTIYALNQWYKIDLKPNDEIILANYDIDTEAVINWVIKNIHFV